jgi:SAM-dependent methyltransferase
MRFQTAYQYHSRAEKARYVWDKYREILQSSVLDVGADEKHLTNHLPPTTRYWGIGLGGNPDQEVDLEKGVIPFADDSFETVLCLDVLEHLDNPHEVFDEICRVSSRHVIVSLPNAWATILQVICFGDFAPNQHMKFYGFPPDKPVDRHKWFLSYDEAKYFIEQRGRANHMRVVQTDRFYSIDFRRWKNRAFRAILSGLMRFSKVDSEQFLTSATWAVLEKTGRVP